MKPAVSLTHSVGGAGIGVSALSADVTGIQENVQRLSAKKAASRAKVRNLEFHLGCFFGSGLRREIGFLLKAVSKETGDHDSRKRVAFCVEGLCSFIESHALDSNSILRAFELRLKIPEILSGFKLRISFGNDH